GFVSLRPTSPSVPGPGRTFMSQSPATASPRVRVTSKDELPRALIRDQFDAWNAYAVPPTMQVAEGTWCIPLPLAGSSLGFVYCYALAVDDGVVLIDTGAGDAGIADHLWSELAAIGYGPI